MRAIFTTVLLVFVSDLMPNNASLWSYKKLGDWPSLCQNGQKQSPINLRTSHGKVFSPKRLKFQNYDQHINVIINNGHTVQLKVLNASKVPSISGGEFHSEYKLDHIHFHWHSEHTIDSSRFPLEAHAVHYISTQPSLDAAVKSNKKNAILVLGILHEFTDHKPKTFDTVQYYIEKVLKPNTQTTLDPKLTFKMFLPAKQGEYFQYSGSLTTPGCQEIVKWIVFTNRMPIHFKQLESFRKIENEDGPMKQNYRQVQHSLSSSNDVPGRDVRLAQGAAGYKSNIILLCCHVILLYFLFI